MAQWILTILAYLLIHNIPYAEKFLLFNSYHDSNPLALDSGWGFLSLYLYKRKNALDKLNRQGRVYSRLLQ